MKMRKSLMVLFSVLMVFLVGCGNDDNGGTAYTEVNVEEGINFTLNEDTLKNSRATFTLANETEAAINYSTHEYHFEQMKDGQWQEFTGTAQSDWGDETSVLEAGQTVELSYDWKTLCGNTAKNTQYRLIILVNDSPVAAEFTAK
ncbi:immunoglobulin-like domain-containing protein [Anaerotignum sp.]|uniref:immunoglobulin-like domain-containing protein n=1 Tax=Anaerotignum sp. TaxID=2039241 RepID=UPI0028AA8ACC|nr:immunoglobulin-like domain-containing protein [Anaerotignum sp.]